MHGITTLEEIPAAARTEQAAWDEVISDIWRSVLGPFCGPGVQTAIEVGPGTSCKVALGLAKNNFKGDIYVVDVAENAISAMRRKYAEYCPAAKVTCLQSSLEDCLPALPARPDLLLLSHVIDDMLMYEATRALPERRNALDWCAGKAYKLATTPSYHDALRDLEQDHDRLEKSKQLVLSQLKAMVGVLRPKIMILSQYPSATLAENGLDSMNVHTRNIFAAFSRLQARLLRKTEEVQLLLDRNKNYNHDHIGNNILNAENWIIYEDKDEQG